MAHLLGCLTPEMMHSNNAEWLLFAHCEGMGQVSAGVCQLRQKRFGTAPFGARW